MYKRKIRLRAAAALAAGAALCGLLAGCARAPASSGPQATSGAEQAARLDDGVLRQVYAADAILCGNQVLCHLGVHDSAYLLTDSVTGETDYYRLGRPSGSDAYSYALYDKQGALILESGSLRPTCVFNGRWLFLSDAQYEDYGTDGPALYKMADLSADTPALIEMPVYTSNVDATADGYFAFTKYGSTDANGEWVYSSTVTITNDRFETVETFENCQVNNYGPFDTSKRMFQIVHTDANGSPNATFLYCPSTGETIGGVESICGENLVCHDDPERRAPIAAPSADGEYVVYNTATKEYLARFDTICTRYTPNAALLQTVDEEGNDLYSVYENGVLRPVLQQLLPDYSVTGRFAAVEENGVTVYHADGTRQAQCNTPLVSSYSDSGSTELTMLSDGSLLYRECVYIDGMYPDTSTYTLYRGDETAFTFNDYSYVSQWEGTDYFLCEGSSKARMWLMEIRSEDGELLVNGLQDASPIPGTRWIAARRGFEVGILDIDSGEWLWHESAFHQATDENSNFY